jgi:hypothetical protein
MDSALQLPKDNANGWIGIYKPIEKYKQSIYQEVKVVVLYV